VARKDFAESGGRRAARKAPAGGPGQLQSMLLVIGILLVVAGSFAGGFWLGKGSTIQQKEGISKEAKDQLLAQIRDQQQELTALRKKLSGMKGNDKPASKDAVGDLTFYNSLPKQAVTPAPMSRSPTAPHQQFAQQEASGTSPKNGGEHPSDATVAAPSVSAQGGFRVQVGSYQNRSDAEGLKARFRQHGILSRVEETDVPELGVWYRVYLGPYASSAQADAAIKLVQQRMHITGLLLRDK